MTLLRFHPPFLRYDPQNSPQINLQYSLAINRPRNQPLILVVSRVHIQQFTHRRFRQLYLHMFHQSSPVCSHLDSLLPNLEADHHHNHRDSRVDNQVASHLANQFSGQPFSQLVVLRLYPQHNLRVSHRHCHLISRLPHPLANHTHLFQLKREILTARHRILRLLVPRHNLWRNQACNHRQIRLRVLRIAQARTHQNSLLYNQRDNLHCSLHNSLAINL